MAELSPELGEFPGSRPACTRHAAVINCGRRARWSRAATTIPFSDGRPTFSMPPVHATAEARVHLGWPDMNGGAALGFLLISKHLDPGSQEAIPRQGPPQLAS